MNVLNFNKYCSQDLDKGFKWTTYQHFLSNIGHINSDHNNWALTGLRSWSTAGAILIDLCVDWTCGLTLRQHGCCRYHDAI